MHHSINIDKPTMWAPPSYKLVFKPHALEIYHLCNHNEIGVLFSNSAFDRGSLIVVRGLKAVRLESPSRDPKGPGAQPGRWRPGSAWAPTSPPMACRQWTGALQMLESQGFHKWGEAQKNGWLIRENPRFNMVYNGKSMVLIVVNH